MNKKISVLIVTLLIISALFVVNIDINVKAESEEEEQENNSMDLPFDFMWDDVIWTLSNAIYEAYPGLKITRGREMGTLGDNWSANKIYDFMDVNCSLENVKKLPLGPIEGLYKRFYTSRINVTDYLLHIDIDSESYYHDVPVNESFVIPAHQPMEVLGGLTFNFTLDDQDDIIVIRDPTNWPLGGSLTNYYLNLSITPANWGDIIIGNATYLGLNDALPDDQENRVFIFDEEETEGVERLKNITNATGVMLIHDVITDYNIPELDNYNFSIVRTESDDSNLTQILEILENETMLVENIMFNDTLTFTYNLSSAILPDSDFVILSRLNFPSTGKIINKIFNGGNYNILSALQSVFWRVINFALGWIIEIDNLSKCKGYIFYDSISYGEQYNVTHYMNHGTVAKVRGGWFRDMDSSPYERFHQWGAPFGMPGLPFFFVNNSIGTTLLENYTEAKISGYVDQEYLKETHWPPWDPSQWTAGLDAFNVIGNLSKDGTGNPFDQVDPTILISNRYDSWWTEAPIDSGCGAGVVLAIAKYFNDYDITPKVNITFLETTGEEYMFRGAQHFSDSHPNMNYTHWIGFDQLAIDWPGITLNMTYNDDNVKNITEAIANQMGYPKRTDNGYDIVHEVTTEFTAAEEDVWKQRANSEDEGGIEGPPCKTICFIKDGSKTTPFRHRRGEQFTAGDIMENIDREDLNDTLELAWSITKYFCVNPDCWIDDEVSFIFDSDDADDLEDSYRYRPSLISILPYDQVMMNYSLTSVLTNTVVTYETVNFSVNRSTTMKEVNITLPAGKSPGFYVFRADIYNSTGWVNEILDPTGGNYNQTRSSGFIFLYPYGYSLTPPNITNVADSPDRVGYGFNVTISADVTSEASTIDTVTVNISYPDESLESYTMSNTVGDTYEYVFNDTWQHGQYDYVIWAKDSNGNESGSSQYSFNVSAQATVTVCTVKDEYGNNTIVNVTDPPSNLPLIGYELLDDDNVLHMWNKYDSYYFNISNGVQFSNHYNEYWSHNVLMLGYYNNDMWNLIYRTNELSGFNKNISSDNETFVNATLWKDLSYGGYDFRLAIRYHLGVDDNELTVIPYIKNIDDEDIPYNLGFAWEINNIQIDMTPGGDYIEINGTTYYLNGELDETYKNLDSPCFYIREDLNGDNSESLYLRWDENLNYKVRVKSRDGQYNSPVTLGIKIGTLAVNQEKYTELFWHDASEAVYYFDDVYYGEAWASNPGNMVDGSTSNYASTSLNSDVELCINNTCYGAYLGLISKVEIRAFGYWSGLTQRDIILRPVFSGGDGNNHVFMPPRDVGDWSPWFDITYDKTPSFWDWSDVRALDCDVEAGSGMGGFTLYCSKVEIRVTYIPNLAPIVYNPVPSSGSTGVGIQPVLSITVSDADGDNMNITWLSNSSGSWVAFGTNSSVGDGTYHQTMVNASMNGGWWCWKVNVSDGLNYTVSSVFSFYTGYESKIVNTGSTSIKGYLLIQVQYYNTSNSTWVVADDTINETSPRTILWENPAGTPGQHILALDTIFNGNVNTTYLIDNFGTGTYRIYAAFRDPDGTVLVCDDESLMEDTYEFTVSES